MFRALVFLAGPSSRLSGEKTLLWTHWQPKSELLSTPTSLRIYIADAGLQAFLSWYEILPTELQSCLESITWCGDGDSLGKHGKELRAHTAARFEGRWREHLYDQSKDFSDCAAMTSLLEYDLRHAVENGSRMAWIEVHGALGGRLDHELVNLLEFSESLSRMDCQAAFALGPDIVLTTLPVVGNFPQGERFSVISLRIPSQSMVEISGAEFSGRVFLRQASHGLSNVVQQPPVSINPLDAREPLLLIHVTSAYE